MDSSRFDDLARLLGAAAGRRPVLRALLGAALGAAVSDTTETAARTRKRGKDRGRDRDADQGRGQDRDKGQNRLQAEGRGKKRRKKKKKRGGSGGGQTPPPSDCCGTEQCGPPEPGSTRSECDYAARFFAGHDFNGSIFRGIDGRGTDFTAADLHGSVFAEACLQGASFRSARLGGSTWGDACLFDADFTGAEFGGDLTLFDDARFCGTTMPDGSTNDRDCGRETACCRAELGGNPACQRDADCPPNDGLRCVGGQCVCDGQSCPDGCCFSDSGGSICLDGKVDAFCGGGGEACVDCGGGARCVGQVCVCLAGLCDGCCENGPNNPGRCLANTPPVCGVDGAQCRSCPTGDGRTCNGQGQCVCTFASCPTGCCSDGPGNPGTCVESQCTQDNDCPNVRDCVCDQAQGTCCGRNCDGKVCGPDGCGGDCENLCPPNSVCSPDGTECLCTAQSCPNGCCSNGPGNPGTCEPGNINQACGRLGQTCQTCNGQEQCVNRQCVCVPKTCADLGRSCGTAPDGCGGTLECGVCPVGDTASCSSEGVCVGCPAACGGAFCLNLTNGDTVCCGCVPVNCGAGCSSNAECPSGQNAVCMASFTPDDEAIMTVASICGAGVPAICSPLIDCFGPNCGGSQ